MAPTLVLVPGSFVTSASYDDIAQPLRAKGYTVHVLDPPCYPKGYKKGTAPPSMYEDAKFVSDFVAGLEEDVVLVAHSYGGIPATQSLDGISKAARTAAGKKGGVIRLAYLTALAPKLGNNLGNTVNPAGGEGTLQMGVDEDGWLYHSDHAATQAIVFNSLSPEDGASKMSVFGRHSSTCFGNELTYAGYKDVPVSYFLCEDDLCVLPEVQQTCIDTIEASWKGTEREGTKVDVTRVKCDHMPIYSARDETEKWMEGLLK